MNRLDEIKARWAAATPRPWTTHGPCCGLVVASDVVADVAWKHVATGSPLATREADKAAIAAAPDDVAYLLDLVDRLEDWLPGRGTSEHRHLCTLSRTDGREPCDCGLGSLQLEVR